VGRFTRQQTFLLALLFTLGLLVAPRSVAWALDAPARGRSFLATAPDTSVAITLTEFTITPASITVPLGEPVTFVVTNAGGAQHNLVVELESRGIEQRLFATNLLPGETRRVTFTFDASGNWEMYCPVGNHRALGMQGTIQVAERTTPTPAPTAQPTPSPPAATATPVPTAVPTVVSSPNPTAGPVTTPTPVSTPRATPPFQVAPRSGQPQAGSSGIAVALGLALLTGGLLLTARRRGKHSGTTSG
jgi:plastocyanin